MQPHERLDVSGRDCSLTLVGKFQALQVDGSGHYLKLDGVDSLELGGLSHTVDCATTPRSIRLRGRGHRVRLPAGGPEPRVDVEGKDHAVQFQRPNS
jgi:hypothetical protein